MDANEFLNKNKNRILNLAIIIFALFVSGKIYKQQSNNLAALKEQNDLELKKSEILESIGKSARTVEAYKNLLNKKDASIIIDNLSDFAKEANVKITSIKPIPQQKFSEYVKKIPFILAIEAPNYHALGNFVSKIESCRDVYMIDSIDVRGAQQSKNLTVNLTISSIVFK